MVNTIWGIIQEAYFLLNKMSIYLLLGFLFAGIIHIFLKEGTIGRHLGKNNFWSVIKASLFGIPLPLCSCGVVPAAMSLKKEGASRGSILSFLISTPTSGVDSILATYSLLGGFFALYRVIASFLSGVLAGILANLLVKEESPPVKQQEAKCKLCANHEGDEHAHPFSDKVKGALSYAFVELLEDIGKWLLMGILIGGAIAYFLPEEFIHNYLGTGWRAMVLMLIIGIPMYVCATGSIPIAAALVLKGLNPGAAFVFLLAGPATNSMAVTVISKQLGKKATVIYLASIAVSSVVLGLLLDKLGQIKIIDMTKFGHRQGGMIPYWLEISATVILVGLVLYNMLKSKAD